MVLALQRLSYVRATPDRLAPAMIAASACCLSFAARRVTRSPGHFDSALLSPCREFNRHFCFVQAAGRSLIPRFSGGGGDTSHSDDSHDEATSAAAIGLL